MAAEFLIDGMMSGTGIRDAINGGYIEPSNLGLSRELARDIERWGGEYRTAHMQGHPEHDVAELDRVGLSIMARAQNELPTKELGYFSDGRLKRLV